LEAKTSLTTTKPEALAGLRLFALLLALAGFGLPLGGLAAAQTGIQVADSPSPEYTFGKILTFRVSVRSETPLSNVTLLYRVAPADTAISGPAVFMPGQEVTATYTLDLAARPLTPFTRVEYWWEIRDEAGRQLTTEPQPFHYLDNRFDWQSLSQFPLTVHWYKGSLAFGQSALNIAASSLTQANRLLQVTLPEAIDIYIYADETDAQAALEPAGRLWADGRADPALNLVILSVAPDLEARLNLEHTMPHELTHLLIYQITGQQSAQVPSWLNEGLAVMSQAQTDPQFQDSLAAARDAGKLLPLVSLCGPFPADQAQAQLAYAESESVVRYLQQQYTNAGVLKLLAAYAASGVTCEAGVEHGLNLSLADLEKGWQSAIARPTPAPLGLAAQQMPWVILLTLVLLAGGIIMVLTLGGQKSSKP
jgi:hypothetical protein